MNFMTYGELRSVGNFLCPIQVVSYVMEKTTKLPVVLPIPDVKDVEELLGFLKGYGDYVALNDAGATPKNTIVVGKIVQHFNTFKDPNGEDKKVYYLESAVPGDSSTYRFVASGRRIVNLIDDVFSAGVGDYLALHEPMVMTNAVDHLTVYLPNKRATVWFCKLSPRKNIIF